jgi:hypothetical protein
MSYEFGIPILPPLPLESFFSSASSTKELRLISRSAALFFASLRIRPSM